MLMLPLLWLTAPIRAASTQGVSTGLEHQVAATSEQEAPSVAARIMELMPYLPFLATATIGSSCSVETFVYLSLANFSGARRLSSAQSRERRV